MKKILTLFLAILMLIGTVPLVVSADDTQPPSTFEVVLLLDTSGSMVNKEWDGGSWVGSDPEMISIEAAKAFASYYPSSAKYFNVSIVLYNSAVMVGLKNVNVANPENIEPYNAFLDEVKACTGNSKNAADKAFVGKYGFSCWTGDTDIGSAMVAAQSILDASSAEKKAVILFSDGKIDLSGENSAEKEAASEKAAFDSAKHFAETDTVVYTIGLSKTADGVDREFMQKLADDTNGEFRYCQDANKVFGFFQDMYTDFIEGTIREEEEYEVLPDVPVSHSMNIYGQVISEMNLVLFSDTPIKTYTVTNPNGVVVAELKANGKESTSSGCIIHRNERTVTVKLITPTDGNWSINFTSSSVGTVKVREIFSYSLDVQSDTPEQVVVGDNVSFTPTIFNSDTDTRVTTKEIYDNAVCTITVKSSSTNNIYRAELNSARNGYKFSLDFDTPGDYQITYSIKHEQFEAITTKTLKVLNPKLTLSTENTTMEAGQPVKVVCKLENPLTGQPMNVPDHLEGFELTANVKLDGNTVSAIPVRYTDGQEISFTYTPEKAGNYQIGATIKSYNNTIESANTISIVSWVPEFEVSTGSGPIALGNEVNFTASLKNPTDGSAISISKHLANAVLTAEIKCNGSTVKTLTATVKEGMDSVTIPFKPTTAGNYTVTLTVNDSTIFESSSASFAVSPSTISLLGELKNIKKGVLFGGIKTAIELGDYFSDSDGDSLIYEVTSDSKSVTAEVVDGVLTVSTKGGAKGTVTIVVKDGRGAEQTVSFKVKVQSYLPLFIILVILVVCIIVAIPIILVVLKKRRTIRMRYRIKLSMNGDSVVYDINRASSNRYAKPMMTVREVLKLRSLATYAGGDMSESDAEKLIQNYCGQVSVTGFPFKDGIKIILPDKKEKVFTTYCQTVQLNTSNDESISDATITFGKTTDFRD